MAEEWAKAEDGLFVENAKNECQRPRGVKFSEKKILKLFSFLFTEFGRREELCNSDCLDSMTQPGTQIEDFPSCSRRAVSVEKP